MNKISMGVAVLVASLGMSGAAFAGSETATTVNGRPVVAPVADSQVQKATPEVGKKTVVADAKSTVGQKPTQEAGKGVVVADTKSTEHKAEHDANKQKPEAAAKVDAKTAAPAPAAVQDNNAKK
ncbi:MAG: hypothetical protein HQL74_15635 [Magnetococcales bacterium]|nr:hypothetical protein [Magnetococcales bacterium]